MRPLAEGAVVGGRYEIREVAGSGGMGTVYCARDRRIDVDVALKELHEPSGTPEERAESEKHFEQEAKLLGQLSHPNLPRVTDYFVEDGRYYLVMEFVQGQTLERRLGASRAALLPLAEILNWGAQIADVLSYLHSQKPPIVFRDVKPANIMVTPDGSIKMIDFGIAGRIQPDGAAAPQYGSPGYAPPEQYGRSAMDPRSDIYALGATLHHLITGRAPEAAQTRFPSVRSLDPSLPASLDAFITRCLQPDPARRFQSAREALQALTQIRAEGPGPTRRTPVPAAPPARSSYAAAAALILLVLGVGAGGIFAFRAMRPESPPGVAKAESNPARVPPPAAHQVPQTARLSVESQPPGAAVTVDGKTFGVTPTPLQEVAPGEHSITVTPPPGSGLAPHTETVTVEAGHSAPVRILLSPLEAPPAGPVVSQIRVQIQPVGAADGTGELQVHVGFMVSGATGKAGRIAAFFYDADGKTPLRPRTENPEIRSPEGQLAVAEPFSTRSDPESFPDFMLRVPESEVLIPLDRLRVRIGWYFDNRPAAFWPDDPPPASPATGPEAR